ncbi:MAG: hypothetical protein ACK5LZ_04915 [Anaerorhabdus sp.]
MTDQEYNFINETLEKHLQKHLEKAKNQEEKDRINENFKKIVMIQYQPFSIN